jgi:hypothetical protein
VRLCCLRLSELAVEACKFVGIVEYAHGSPSAAANSRCLTRMNESDYSFELEGWAARNVVEGGLKEAAREESLPLT